jgi:hypothetical protein
MRRHQAIIATTHLDRHNDRITREALEGMAAQANASYVPQMLEHDFRRPVGRVVSARVVPLTKGEFALEVTSETWDQADTPESVTGDGRMMRLEDPPEALFEVQYDRGTPDEEVQLLENIARLAGADQHPHLMGKKAFEPIRTLEIAAQIAGGAVATGFFLKLGQDLYNTLKERLVQVFRRNPRPRTVRFRFWVTEPHRIEVDIFLEDPSPADIERVMGAQFQGIDEYVRGALDQVPDAVLLVFRWWNSQFILLHAFRPDAFPVVFNVPD